MSEDNKAVVERIDEDSQSGEPGQTFLHPLSGLAILLLDNAFFFGDIATLGLSMPVTIAAAFVSSFASVALIQRLLGKNEWGPALGKALIGGITTGLPFPIAGTVAGGIIMAMSGLKTRKKK